jgi:Flp pilus assembly pilin Flp
MKILSLATLCSAVLLAGCDSMSTRVEDRFTAVSPHTRVFAAGMKAVYEAAQRAVKNVGLQVGRKSIGEGRIEAYAGIRGGDEVRDTRQTALNIRLFETDDGDTRVELLVSENTEGKFPGGVSKQDLREHSLYELYYTALQQVLLESGALKTTANP